MNLREILKNVRPLTIVGNADTKITGIKIDSRQFKPGFLFVAMKGTQVDGHQFIPKAIELGASAILCEDLPETTAEGVTYVQV